MSPLGSNSRIIERVVWTFGVSIEPMCARCRGFIHRGFRDQFSNRLEPTIYRKEGPTGSVVYNFRQMLGLDADIDADVT